LLFNILMKISPLFKLHLIVFLWGFTGVVGKIISISALPLVWVRMLFAFVIVYFYLRYRKIPILISKKLVIKLLLIGGIIALHWYTFFYAIKVSNASIAVSTLSTGALFTSFLEPIFLKKKLNFLEVFLAIIVSICIFIIFKAESKYYIGIIIGLISSFLSALFQVINGKVYKETHASSIVLYELIGGWLLITCMLFGFENFNEIIKISFVDILWLLLLAGILTAYPLIESVSLMKHFSPFSLILTINLEPIYTIIIAYFIWKEEEQMSSVFYICTAVILSMIIINGYIKSKEKTKKSPLNAISK